MSEPTLLTQAEVNELPDGTGVVITWSGGNGPWPYVIAVDTRGQRYAALNADPEDRMRFYNLITFVGAERFHTHVWLAGSSDE